MGSTAKYLELAVILKAVDGMSGTVRDALGGAGNQYTKLMNTQQKATASMSKGLMMYAGAKVGIDMLTDLAKQYANVQEAQNDLRIAIMKPGGAIDEGQINRYIQLSKELSARFGGSQMDYIAMVTAMKNNRLDEHTITGGAGFAIAQLSELFKTAPTATATFAARMSNDLKVPANQMVKMVDMLARMRNIGVGGADPNTSGAETIDKLTEFYANAGLASTNLKLHGLDDAKKLGVLGAMLMVKGIEPGTAGTSIRRILDNISDPAKLKKMNYAAASSGLHLNFFDEKGNFKGVDNFIGQLSTLNGLSIPKLSAILNSVGSKQGLSGDVLKAFSESGKHDYDSLNKKIEDQGTLTQKVAEYQTGLNAQLKITGSNIDNLGANLGKSFNPEVTYATTWTGKLANALSNFANSHQGITKGGVYFAGLTAGAVALGAAFHFAGSAWAYSRMPLLLSWIGDSAMWAAGAIGLRSFAAGLMMQLLPAIEAVGVAFGGMGVIGAGAFAALAAGLVYYLKEVKKGNDMLPDYSKPKFFDPKTAEGRVSPFAIKKEESDYQAWWLKNAKGGVNRATLGRVDFLKIHPGSVDHRFDNLTTYLKNQKQSPLVHNTINYSPVINIPAGASDKAAWVNTLNATLEKHKNDVVKLLKDTVSNHKRVSFAH